jgi:hypothetical protein
MRRLALLLILAATAVLAGCGSKPVPVATLPAGPLTQSQYEDAFPHAAEGLAAEYGVGKPLEADASVAQQTAHVEGLQKVLRAWATRLESLQPPAVAARAQTRYVAGIRSFAGDLDRALAALDRGDAKGANALLTSGRIVSARTRADLVAARRAFHALGYDLEDLDSSPVKTD